MKRDRQILALPVVLLIFYVAGVLLFIADDWLLDGRIFSQMPELIRSLFRPIVNWF